MRMPFVLPTSFATSINSSALVVMKERSSISRIVKELREKTPGQVDSPEVLKIKGLIRRGEAKAGCRSAGITDDFAHFLDMPFYETGR